jgi:hypothetical protein
MNDLYSIISISKKDVESALKENIIKDAHLKISDYSDATVCFIANLNKFGLAETNELQPSLFYQLKLESFVNILSYMLACVPSNYLIKNLLFEHVYDFLFDVDLISPKCYSQVSQLSLSNIDLKQN